MEAKTPRGSILNTARNLTESGREKTYGNPHQNMLKFAALLEGYFKSRYIYCKITAEDAAWIMVLAKMARTTDQALPSHRDNYIDAAAYVAMAGEIAELEREAEADA